MYAEIMNTLAEMEQEEDHKFYPRPSLAGPERCIRSMVYWSLGMPKQPFPGRTLHVFNDGIFHEELVLDWLRKSTSKVHSEQMEVACRPPMRKGHIDCILTDMLGNDRLMEIKGLNHFTFERFWSGSEYPMDYFTQMAIYIDAIQRESNPELKECILFIKNKNTSAYIEYLCEYRDDILLIKEKTRSTGEREKLDIKVENIVGDACKKFFLVEDYTTRKTLPKRPYDIDHWRCQYCGWAAPCWESYEKEFNELEINGMLPDEVADMIRYKNETSAHRLEMQKEEKELTEKIKTLMKDSGVREGKAGEYHVKLSLIKSERIDKSLLSSSELEKATKISQYEKLNIKKLKEPANASV